MYIHMYIGVWSVCTYVQCQNSLWTSVIVQTPDDFLEAVAAETKHSAKCLTEKVADAASSIAELLQTAHYAPPTKPFPHTIAPSKATGGSKKKAAKKATSLTSQEKDAEHCKHRKNQHPLQEFEGSSQAIAGSELSVVPGSPHLLTMDKSANAITPTVTSPRHVRTVTSLRHSPYAESDVARSVVKHYNQQLQESLKAAILSCLQQLHDRLITAHKDNQSVLQSSDDAKREPASSEGEEGKLAAICFTLGIQFFIPRVAIYPSLDNLCSGVEECTALVVGTSSSIESPLDISTEHTMHSVLRKDADIRGMQHKILVALRGKLSEERAQPFNHFHILHFERGQIYHKYSTYVHMYEDVYRSCTAAS